MTAPVHTFNAMPGREVQHWAELRAQLVAIALKEALRGHFGAPVMGRPPLTNEERAAFAVKQADAIIREMKKA
jgi:hypothetical protein